MSRVTGSVPNDWELGMAKFLRRGIHEVVMRAMALGTIIVRSRMLSSVAWDTEISSNATAASPSSPTEKCLHSRLACACGALWHSCLDSRY